MTMSFYDAACYIELAGSIEISAADQLRIDELFCRAMENITRLLAIPLNPYGCKFSDITDVNTLFNHLPANWGVSLHRKPAQSGEGGKWTCLISMTTFQQDLTTIGNTVAGKSSSATNAVIAALLRAGQHLEISALTDPNMPDDLPPIAA